MAIEVVFTLRIEGPTRHAAKELREGEPHWVLGRDAGCNWPLEDPNRVLSRRHLAMWVEAGSLHFHVISAVNGVELPFGEAPAGARGVLAHDQTLRLGEYSVNATAVEELTELAGLSAEAAWGALDSPHERTMVHRGPLRGPLAPTPQASLPAGSPARSWSQSDGSGMADSAFEPLASEDDPFGGWSFQTVSVVPLGVEREAPPGPESPTVDFDFDGEDAAGASPLLNPPAPVSAANASAGAQAVWRGLGRDTPASGNSDEELQALGAMLRTTLLTLLRLGAAQTQQKAELNAEDRTRVVQSDDNPLHKDWPVDTKLAFLLGGKTARIGFMSQERALEDLCRHLLDHNEATRVASQAVVEGTLRDLSPARLRETLDASGMNPFESARLWDAFERMHDAAAEDTPKWLDQLFSKHFAGTYLRERERLRRGRA